MGGAAEPVWVFAGERAGAGLGSVWAERSITERVRSGCGVEEPGMVRRWERSRARAGIQALPVCPQVLAEKRNLGSRDGPPHLVVVVLLHSRAAAQDSLRLLQSQDGAAVRADEGGAGGFALLCPRLKQRWRFVTAQAGEEAPLLVGFWVPVPLAAPLTEVFWVQGISTLF